MNELQNIVITVDLVYDKLLCLCLLFIRCIRDSAFQPLSSDIISNLNKSHTSSARDGHSFSKRIINMLNSLPDCIVLSKSVDTFRMHVNKMHFSDYCCNTD